MKDPLAAVSAVAHLIEETRRIGVDISISSNFARFREALEATPKAGGLQAPFDSQVSDLGVESGFWMGGTDAAGSYVHFQAFRTSFFDQAFHVAALRWLSGMHASLGEVVCPESFIAQESALTARVGPRAVYHGALWIDRSFKLGLDDKGMVDLLPRIGLLLAYIKWQPSAVWGISSNRDIRRGAAARYGYPGAEPDFVEWLERPEGWGDKEGLLVATEKDLEALLERTLRTETDV